MWMNASIVAWLVELGIRPGGPVHVDLIDVGGPGIDIPEFPDRIAIVTPTAGAGLSVEGVFDSPGFQLRIRGPQNDPLTAEAMALTADKLITRAAKSCRLSDGTYLLDIQRSGGRPTQLEAAGVDGDRTTLVATYITTINDD